jgi:two-component system, cell cycle sensor histidine kinase and response regulator CckA
MTAAGKPDDKRERSTATAGGLDGAEELYQSAVRAMSEGIVVHAQDGSIEAANPSAEQILGLTLDELTGRAAVDPRFRLVRTDGSPLPQEEIPSEITRRTGKPCRRHLLGVHRPSGELAWLSVNTDPVGPPAGNGSSVVAVFSDVTAELDAKAELERSRTHLQRVLSAVPGVVYEYARTNAGQETFRFVSERASELFGVPAETWMSNPELVWARVHKDDRSKLLDAVTRSARDLSRTMVELRIGDEQAGYRWTRIYATPGRTPSGVTWTAVALDVHEQHELEAALFAAQRREATAQLAAGFAHNFNNMLAVILPSLELALRRGGAPEVLRDAQAAANDAAELVRELLALSRKDRLEDLAATADLAEIARDVVRLCRRIFDRSITLDERIPEGRAWVRGQSSALHQVVLNLCLNARDALSGREKPRLAVELERAEPEQGATEFVLRVIDNGCGMDDATLARIGEPFFTTKGPARGTGLGLASAFSTVRELGGAIDCLSRRDAGTTFTVRLPALDHTAVKVPSQPPLAEAEPPLRTQRILLVDDEPTVRKVVRSMIELTGRQVVEAADGLTALERAERDGPFDAVFLDLSLPGLPGAKVLARLRERYPALPVIIVSGYVADDVALDGAAMVLQKPVSLAQLNEVLDRL